MFARWPGLFIQAVITASASAWPRAMFSPPRSVIPRAFARSQGVWPSGSVWSKKPRAAMSSLNAWARPSREELAVSALQPAVARSLLTSDKMAALAAVSLSVLGAVVGALVAGGRPGGGGGGAVRGGETGRPPGGPGAAGGAAPG